MTMALHPGEVHRPSTPPSISSAYVPARELPLETMQVLPHGVQGTSIAEVAEDDCTTYDYALSAGNTHQH